MVLIAMTGGNGDVGIETCKQAAAFTEVDKILITTRSEEKGAKSIQILMEETGKDESFFEHVILDLTDYDSIVNAAKAFPPKVDRLCLNAGGAGNNEKHLSGATDCMVMNTIGHALLVDELFKLGKIPDGSRVVFVGSEVSRPLYSLVGFLPNYSKLFCGKFGEKEIDWAIGENYSENGLCGFFPLRAQLGDYKNAKIVGSLFFSHMAKEHPNVHFLTISPGGIHNPDGGGTGFTNGVLFPMNVLMSTVPKLFSHVLRITQELDVGCSRLLDGVLTGDETWDNGAVVLSGRNGCGLGLCYWGAKGPVIDNRPSDPYFSDEILCEKAAIKVREWQAIWASKAANGGTTYGSTMDR